MIKWLVVDITSNSILEPSNKQSSMLAVLNSALKLNGHYAFCAFDTEKKSFVNYEEILSTDTTKTLLKRVILNKCDNAIPRKTRFNETIVTMLKQYVEKEK